MTQSGFNDRACDGEYVGVNESVNDGEIELWKVNMLNDALLMDCIRKR